MKVTYASANAQWALVARYRAAELMLAMGRKADAVALYKKLVEQTKGTVQGAYAEQRLQQLLGGPAPSKGSQQKAPKGGTDHAPAARSH
ncbi:MAG: hypothetical protein P8Z49_04515 [Acidobacteriota bacterium]